jgi:hypothetical protein
MTSSGNRVAWNANNRPPVAARHDAIQRPFKLNSWCPQHSPLAPNECHKSTAEKPFSDEKLGGALLAAPGGVRNASGSRKRLPSSSRVSIITIFLETIGAADPMFPMYL